MNPGDRVRHHNPLTGQVEDGRLLMFKLTAALHQQGLGTAELGAGAVSRPRRRAYCSLDISRC